MVVMMLPKASFAFLAPLFTIKHCRVPSAPDRSSPRGYSQKTYFEYRLKVDCAYLDSSDRSCILISLGARSALPMVVAPEAIVEIFLRIDSKNELFFSRSLCTSYVDFSSTSLVIINT
jgi:hypothetical protein